MNACRASALGDLAPAIGRSDFAERLLGLADRLVAHDWTTPTRDPRFSKPDDVVHPEGFHPEGFHPEGFHPEGFSACLVARYLEEAYRVDPFYRFWREAG